MASVRQAVPTPRATARRGEPLELALPTGARPDSSVAKPAAALALPRHIAIVMDGNGRWARRRARPRSFGHRAGQKAVRAAVEYCLRNAIGVLTLFAFSSENWQRPGNEVRQLMALFLRAIDREIDELHRNQVRVRFVGDLAAFSEPLRQRMDAASERTAGNSHLILNVCVSYGGRWDIAQAARHAAEAIARGELTSDALDEHTLAPYFCLADVPPPDLFIRTGGERRISNFLLWQLAYTELYFTDTLWPDMDAAEFDRALASFASRERRFGCVPAALAATG